MNDSKYIHSENNDTVKIKSVSILIKGTVLRNYHRFYFIYSYCNEPMR